MTVPKSSLSATREALPVSRVSRAIDSIEVTFDDETLVAEAGLIVPATLMGRLGLEALVNQTVRLVGRVGGALPGRKILTLVAAMLAGGSHIDHADKLRAGATGDLTVRADAGFWNYALIDTLVRLGVRWSVTVRINPSIRKAIAEIDEAAWTTIAYPDSGQAQVAETTYVTGQGRHRRELRLVVRRTRLTETAQRRLSPDWRHHAFITNVELPTVAVDQFHRDHATVELAIRDLKAGAGLEHCPSGRFCANAAWLGCAVLAHTLIRWTVRLGNVTPPTSSPSHAPSE